MVFAKYRLPTVDRFKTIKQQIYSANDIFSNMQLSEMLYIVNNILKFIHVLVHVFFASPFFVPVSPTLEFMPKIENKNNINP